MDKELKEKIFKELKLLLSGFNKYPLEAHDKYIDSEAVQIKSGYHLYSKKETSLFGKKPQKIFFAGIIEQKNYVSFYFSPIYSHPNNFKNLSPDLKRFLKGKSCFNLTELSDNSLKEIKKILDEGLDLYKKEGWV